MFVHVARQNKKNSNEKKNSQSFQYSVQIFNTTELGQIFDQFFLTEYNQTFGDSSLDFSRELFRLVSTSTTVHFLMLLINFKGILLTILVSQRLFKKQKFLYLSLSMFLNFLAF